MQTILIPLGLIAVFSLLIFTKQSTSRNSNQWKLIRQAVLRRDHYTCQKCGKNGGYLEVHHKESWASRPDLRFVMSNLITYCLKCHQQTDSYKYWKSKQ
jgi:5-methylcytosine-specific restriction endonuclease McrA